MRTAAFRLPGAVLLIALSACSSSDAQRDDELYRVDPPEVILQAARALMEEDRNVALVTVDSRGQPRVRTVRTFLNDFDPLDPRKGMTVWIMTRDSTRKVGQINENSNVTLYFNNDARESYVSIMGAGTVHTDPNAPAVQPFLALEGFRQFFWPEFPKGFVMIEVQPRWVEYIGAGVPNHQVNWRPQAVTFSETIEQ
jgi:general stress protein 26